MITQAEGKKKQAKASRDQQLDWIWEISPAATDFGGSGPFLDKTTSCYRSAPDVVSVSRPCFTPLVEMSASATF